MNTNLHLYSFCTFVNIFHVNISCKINISLICSNLRLKFHYFHRHTSKFYESVRDEDKAKKTANKTMGPAKVQTRPPQDFLKRHEGEPKMTQSTLCNSFLTVHRKENKSY